MNTTTNAMLSTLLVLATAIEFLFNAGERTREFWEEHNLSERTLDALKVGTAAIITAGLIAFEGGKHIWNNREVIKARVEEAFVYRYEGEYA